MHLQPTAYTVLLGLLLFGLGYAWVVRKLRKRKRDHGYTAWLVVVGNAAVGVGFGFIAGLEAAVILLLCNAAAGIPMIVEYIDDHLRHEEEDSERATAARLLRELDD